MRLENEEILRRIYEALPVGDTWPYDASGSRDAIEAHLRATIAELECSDLVAVKANFGDFQAGFASFVEVLCFRKDGSFRRRYGTGEIISGILFYLSCVAPVAVFGPETRTYHRYGGVSGFLDLESIGLLPEGEWSEVHEEVCTKLRQQGFDLPEREVLERALPFPARIWTILSDPPYRVFDLVFHWDD